MFFLNQLTNVKGNKITDLNVTGNKMTDPNDKG